MRDDRVVEIALPLGVFRKIFQMIPNSTVLDTAALKAARDFGDAIMKADNDMEPAAVVAAHERFKVD